MTVSQPGRWLTLLFSLLGLAFPAAAQDAGRPPRAAVEEALKRPYSPYASRHYPLRPLFGDTHLHTALSLDAGAAGARLGPREAYRFAKGEEVISNTGQPVKLSRPLDFLVVADHTDNMRLVTDLFAGKP